MQRQKFCDLALAAAVKLLERMSDGAVIGAATALEEVAVGGFLRQRVTKDVNRPLGLAALVDEFETAELAQLVFGRAGTVPHRVQQGQREFPADHRSDLQQPLGLLRQPIDPRHHDIVDRVRNHQVRADVPRLAGIQCQLLEKERIAICLGDDFMGDQVDEVLGAEHRADHLNAVVPGQRLQRRLPGIGLVNPRRPVAGPIGRQQQDARVANTLRQEPDEFL